jgi:hypothetical protein
MRAGRSLGGAAVRHALDFGNQRRDQLVRSQPRLERPRSMAREPANLGRHVGFVALDYRFKISDLTTDHEKRCPRHTAAKAHSADAYRGRVAAPGCSLLPAHAAFPPLSAQRWPLARLSGLAGSASARLAPPAWAKLARAVRLHS